MSDTRDQLAERLQLAVHQAMDVHCGSHEMDECAAFTAALLPTVERIATERAAEARREALHDAYWAVHVRRFDKDNDEVGGPDNFYNGVLKSKAAVAAPAEITPDTVEQAARAMMDKATDGLLVWETPGVAGQEKYLDLAAAALSVVPGPDVTFPHEHACHVGCSGGACETCPCCCAGWCVFGLDGLPSEADDLSMWLDVAAEHNPVVAAVRAVLDLAMSDDENRALSRATVVATLRAALAGGTS